MQQGNDSVPNFFTFLAVPGTQQPRTVTERHGAPQNGTRAGKPRAGRVTPSAQSCASCLYGVCAPETLYAMVLSWVSN